MILRLISALLVDAVLPSPANDTPLPTLLVAAVLLSPTDVPLAVAEVVRSRVGVADPLLPLYFVFLS